MCALACLGLVFFPLSLSPDKHRSITQNLSCAHFMALIYDCSLVCIFRYGGKIDPACLLLVRVTGASISNAWIAVSLGWWCLSSSFAHFNVVELITFEILMNNRYTLHRSLDSLAVKHHPLI